MKRSSKLFLTLAAFALMGQGCLSFGGGTTSADGGVWQSTDGGNNWAHLVALPQESGVGTIGGVNVNDVEIDPGDDSAYYLATSGNGMFVTYDNGTTWQRPEDALVRSGNVLTVEVDPRDVCTIYALKPDRILKSTDCARTFSSVFVESRERETLTALVIDWFNPDVLWAGNSNGEILVTEDAGGNWRQDALFKSDITALEVSNADSRVVLVGTKSKGLYLRNVDDGTFIEYEDILKEYRDADKVFGFTQTANGSRILMNTEYGLLQSDDKGTTWEPIPLLTPPGDVRIWSLTIDPKNPDVMYYGTSSTFHVSVSGGASWDSLDMPSTRAATAMVAHPTAAETVIMGFSVVEE